MRVDIYVTVNSNTIISRSICTSTGLQNEVTIKLTCSAHHCSLSQKCIRYIHLYIITKDGTYMYNVLYACAKCLINAAAVDCTLCHNITHTIINIKGSTELFIMLNSYAHCAGTHTALSFTVDLSSPRVPFPHTWEECVGSGHAALGLRQDWKQQLASVHNNLGFKLGHYPSCLSISYDNTHFGINIILYRRVRFHGILDDDMEVVLENETYNFQKLDNLYDYIIMMGMYPYVELSFMPSCLASGATTYLHYKANVTPPKSFEEWGMV